ncbi:hypothetical protein DZC76_18990 [Pseudomonas sp. phDV1]|nr:hypothetical protein DZC76_18990 [Pseudomonas sp. phDV1]
MELLTSFCLCFLKKPVRQDGVYGAVTVNQPSDRVGGGVTPAVLPHHRTYGSVYGGSCLLTNSISELGSVDVSPAVAKRPDRPSEFPTPTS